jgi:hypothetical protein
MNRVSLEQLNFGVFAALLKTPFSVALSSGQKMALELVSATAPKPPDGNASKAVPPDGTFSLLFHGPGNRPLDQRTYSLEHERIGQFDLFIVPVGLEAGKLQYEAIFNRLKPDRTTCEPRGA